MTIHEQFGLPLTWSHEEKSSTFKKWNAMKFNFHTAYTEAGFFKCSPSGLVFFSAFACV
jgi:hypothetical protein